MAEVTRSEFDRLIDDVKELKEVCQKTYEKLFVTNGGPSVLDRLNHVEKTQEKEYEIRDGLRKWRRGIYAAVIASLIVQVMALAPVLIKWVSQ